MKTKFILKLDGGLGNQMFRYAWARTMQKLYSVDILLDGHAFTPKQIRSLSLTHLEIGNNVKVLSNGKDKLLLYYIAIKKKILDKIYPCRNIEDYIRRAKHGYYKQSLSEAYDCWVTPSKKLNYVDGGWMSENFFWLAKDEVRKEMRVKTPPRKDSVKLIEEIQKCESVAVHIRLGDYLSEQWRSRLYVCDNDYYNKAMRLMEEKVKNPVFYIFSNRPKDFEMIRKDFHFNYPVKLVDMGNPDYEDLRLMYSCKHMIMSNSTYSWWAQYLIDNPSKVVVAPSIYRFDNELPMEDISQDFWDFIEIKQK